MTLSAELGRAAIGEAMNMVLAVAECYFDNADELDWEADTRALGVAASMYNLVQGMCIHLDESGVKNDNIRKWGAISRKRAEEGIALLKLMDEE